MTCGTCQGIHLRAIELQVLVDGLLRCSVFEDEEETTFLVVEPDLDAHVLHEITIFREGFHVGKLPFRHLCFDAIHKRAEN